MNSLTQWWLDQGCSDEELKLINKPCDYKYEGYDKYFENYKRSLLKHVPFGDSLSEFHELRVAPSATEFINYIFFREIEDYDNTLIITSNVEHEAVDRALNMHRRTGKPFQHLALDWNMEVMTSNLHRVYEACRTLPKHVFVYIIGTQISTGEIAPQLLFERLKYFFDKNGISYTLMIDDVHGMYMVPRDYRIFDFVLCTAHALLRKYDMGMLYAKQPVPYLVGWRSVEPLQEYYDQLHILLAHKNQLDTFSMVMKEEFGEFNYLNTVSYKANSAPHIFSLEVKVPPRFIFTQNDWDRLSDLEVRLEHRDIKTDNMFYIRMRGAQYMTFPQLLPEAIQEVKQILKKVEEYEQEYTV